MLVMEWDFKDFAWDSNEDHDHQLDQQKEEINDLAALVGSSSGGAASLYSLMDLKLGSSSITTTAQLVDPKPSSTSSPALFKTKRVTSGIDRHDQKLQVSSSSTTSSCLVDGCKADLSRCREYHRRHRVCELHSKAPIVIIRGQQKRFCQQCSRFHSLVEFDEVKRSCRKRLNGHNQRRRKPKPESFFFTSKNFLSAYQGPRILHFGPPQLCAATNEISMWPLEAKSAADHHCNWLHAIDRQRIPPKSFTGTKRGETQLTFNQPVAPQAKHAISSDGTTRGIDSSCALCLLSSSHPTQSSVNTTNVVSTSTHSGHEQLHMKSFSQLPSYCSSQDHVENKLLMVRPDPDGLLDTGAQKLPILLE